MSDFQRLGFLAGRQCTLYNSVYFFLASFKKPALIKRFSIARLPEQHACMFWVSGPPLCVTVTTAISMWEGSTERQAQGFKDTLLRLPFFGRIIPFHNTLDCKTIERPDIVRSTKFTGLSPLVYSTSREIGSFIEFYTKEKQTLVVSPILTSFHVFKQTVPFKFQK